MTERFKVYMAVALAYAFLEPQQKYRQNPDDIDYTKEVMMLDSLRDIIGVKMPKNVRHELHKRIMKGVKHAYRRKLSILDAGCMTLNYLAFVKILADEFDEWYGAMVQDTINSLSEKLGDTVDRLRATEADADEYLKKVFNAI